MFALVETLRLHLNEKVIGKRKKNAKKYDFLIFGSTVENIK